MFVRRACKARNAARGSHIPGGQASCLKRLCILSERNFNAAGFDQAQTVKRRFHVILPLIPVIIAALAWTALAPVKMDSREALFEIPKGTWARRMAGDKVEILPSRIYLTLGLQDVLLLKNQDEVPQIFGPTLIMPGQSFRLPFAVASEYLFVCSAHASGQMTIIVDPEPVRGLERLRWRMRKLGRAAAAELRFSNAETTATAPAVAGT